MLEAEERPIADRIDGIPTPSENLSLIGHDDALNQLVSAYASGKMHHAILINGPKGIGKATLAFNFAKHVFTFPDISQAPSAFSAQSIAATVQGTVEQGAHPDLLHLTRPWDSKTSKFKTQLSVEEVRRTLPFYGMTAGAGGWRITIVDAADDMNASAANALLKILEEPPKRSLFLVITHSAGRLLPTIRSRCQTLSLNPLSDQHLVNALVGIGIDTDEPDAQKAIKMADGSVRKAIELYQGKVMSDYEAFAKLMQNKASGSASDWVTVHKIADGLARRGQEETYTQFLDLVLGWIGARTRQTEPVSLTDLAGWAALWEKSNRSISIADGYNLDKKQVILSLFADLFQRNKAST